MKHLVMWIMIAFLLFPLTMLAQGAQPLPTVNRTYFFVQSKTNPMPSKKSEELFQKVMEDFGRFLRDNKVAVVNDPASSFSMTEVPMPQLLQNARTAGATTLLYATINVPGKSIEVTATAFALDGSQIWKSGGSCETAEKTPMDVCVKVALETLHEGLRYRIKMDDLPVLASGNK